MAKASTTAKKKSAAKPLAAPAKKAATKTSAAKKPAGKPGGGAPFGWYELATPNPKAANAFYKSVFGWVIKDAGNPAMEYWIINAKDYGVGGVMPLSDELKKMGVPPCWTGYIMVPDTDATAKKLVAAGGKIKRPAFDIPGVGRICVVADPHGAIFILMTPMGSNPAAPPAPGTPGTFGWRELMAGDGEAALKFYAKMFGWKKLRTHDMGPMGGYHIFSIDGKTDSGGMMTKPPHVPFPCWGFYVNVDGVDAAVARVKKAKGKLVNGPMEVPGGQWIAQCIDPWGASFAMVAPKR